MCLAQGAADAAAGKGKAAECCNARVGGVLGDGAAERDAGADVDGAVGGVQGAADAVGVLCEDAGADVDGGEALCRWCDEHAILLRDSATCGVASKFSCLTICASGRRMLGGWLP